MLLVAVKLQLKVVKSMDLGSVHKLAGDETSGTGPVCVAGLGPPFGMRPVPAQATSRKQQA